MPADSLIFALDIGTRSVVGMVGYQDGEDYVVLDYEQAFHEVNAMRDGQIEDIELVASVVRRVKEALEGRCGAVFEKAAIAAAGRALKTMNATYRRELDESEEITRQMIESLEYSVVAMAQESFGKENKKGIGEFFCVGYSVISYKLDDYSYTNLEGHRGRVAELEAVAAFLPVHVVESLHAVCAKNKLEIDNLTLEPIAAINVIVPRDIRLLNIAIVDIGAGTSDIAISRNGSIVAYGMATIAGDEITETIMKKFLSGFDAAEKVKIDWANGGEDLLIPDIFGTGHPVTGGEMDGATDEVISTLCETVAKDILAINSGAPMAVFLVGGGSQTPGLPERIAAFLELPAERVDVGGKQPFRNIRLCSEALINPEFVTPIGIGVVASLYRGCNFFAVTVNGQNIMAINNGEIRVMDALLLAGIKPSRLIGLTSSGISYTVNGRLYTERGNPPVPGSILLNGKEVSIHAEIRAGDAVVAVPAVDGQTPRPTVGEILAREPSDEFMVDDVVFQVRKTAFVNGKKAAADLPVPDGAVIVTDPARNLRELFENIGQAVPENMTFSVNRQPATPDTMIRPGDMVTVADAKETETDGVPEGGERPEAPLPEPEEKLPVPVRPAEKKDARVSINGVWRQVKPKGSELIFVDMLNFVDIDTDKPEGILRMRINGRDASYVDSVADGDEVEIYWESR